jgi:hypothetical protein
VASAALSAVLVQQLPGGVGQHAGGRPQLRDVWSGALRRSPTQPRVQRLPQWDLRQLLGLHALQPLHHWDLRAPPRAHFVDLHFFLKIVKNLYKFVSVAIRSMLIVVIINVPILPSTQDLMG